MKITKLRLAMVTVLLITGATTPWLIQRRSEAGLREEILALRTQLDQMSQQRTEDRPSEPFAQAGSSLPGEQLGELLRLRNEVGLLRQQTNELVKLKVENSQLRAAQPAGRSARPPSLAAGDSVPVQSLAFAGYATPEAAFESTLSAHLKGDPKTFLDGFAPELREEKEKEVVGKSQDELLARAAHFVGTDAQVLKSRLLSEDEAELIVYLAEQKKNQVINFKMKRIAGEWRISVDRN